MSTQEINQKPIVPLKTTEDLLSDFYFLIFMANPAKEIVRVIVDDGTIKFWTKIPKLVNIIKLVMDENMARDVKLACESYGCFYLIDRCNNMMKKLSMKSEDSIINIKQLHNDIEIAKKENKKDQELQQRFLTAINQPILERLSLKNKKDLSFTNKYSGSIFYGVKPMSGYRPY